MTHTTYRPLSALCALALTGALACAGTSVLAADVDPDHSAHQHDGPAATQAPGDSGAKAQDIAMQKQMHAMKAMHEKMMRANTPEERSALMADHMQAMRDGMGMMQKMGPSGGMGAPQGRKSMGCDMHASHRMMGARMEMMESMMQMMMDRIQMLTPEPPGGKQ